MIDDGDDARREPWGRVRMPAEWEPHAGTILTWPHRQDLWRGVHAEVEALFAVLAAEISEGEAVHINVPDEETKDRAFDAIVAAGGRIQRVVWHMVMSDDVWARDHGPVFVKDDVGGLVMLDFEFNAWGGKFPHGYDDGIPRAMNHRFGCPRVRPRIVLEGGSIEVNGRGHLLTTEAVLGAETRNPHLSRDELTWRLEELLGVRTVVWLGRGLQGDDTDGHIDDMVRFVGPRTLVIVAPPQGHPDHEVMADNRARLLADRRRKWDLIDLPMPEPITFQGEMVPASYANFYICNGKVLVPTFAQPSDDKALSILARLFPDRRVVGLDARALVTWNGGIHCVTQQVPRAPVIPR
jgi:agmatine deiminase